MNFTIFLTPAASADIKFAVDYYNSKSDGLGKRMAGEVDLVLGKVAAMLKTYSSGTGI